MRQLAVVAACVAAAGCAVEPAVDVGGHHAPIVGGSLHEGSPAVVMTLTQSGQCTGTLIGERTVLTAGHCIEADVRNGNNSGTVFFGSGQGEFDHTRRINQIRIHRYYTGFAKHDIGLLRLSEDRPAEIEPMPFNLDPLPNIVGQEVRVVGYGVSDGEEQSGGGVKRQVWLTVASMSPQHIGLGDSIHNICQGDSGGPTFLDLDGVETVVAVSSYGADFCRSESSVARVDAFAEEFVIPTYDAWEGPCALDGVCNEDFECPRTPDPDCDECQLNGFCMGGCPRVDLDCPLAGFAGDLCDDNDGCESRFCMQAPDDPRVSFCSQPCDPAQPGGEQCAPPLAVCAAVDGGGVCEFNGPSASTQGAECAAGAECRSGMCDEKFSICVEACSNDDQCSDEYACEKVGGQKVCTIPREGGGICAATGGRAGAGSALLIAFALMFAPRRKRR